MRVVEKAVALVIREGAGGRELLVFRHPKAGVQVPKGTVEAGEALAEATLRELYEESGLRLDASPVLIGQWERLLDGRFGEEPVLDVHRWHVHLIEARDDLPESWNHEAAGSEEEAGLVFAFHWLPLCPSLRGMLHPVFDATIELLLAAERPNPGRKGPSGSGPVPEQISKRR